MISVVIPVLDGEEYLGEVLGAVLSQRIDEDFEVLVIDSGSTDSSLEIVGEHMLLSDNLRLIEIPKSEFGHGRTRNLGVAETSGDLIAFLTQDATPAGDTWLAAYRNAFTLAPKVAAAYGPHLPRPGVNPLMARTLIDHFNSFGEGPDPVVQEPGDTTFLSNSNSCIARAAWQESPFRDIAYAEDQAFGADTMRAGWSKVYVPGAAALHSHDYAFPEQLKRWFDEYRGLNDSIGERTEASASHAAQIIRDSVAADDEFLKDMGMPAWRRAAWSARSAIYHTGRVGFGGLGARSAKLPARVRQAMSYERRSDSPSLLIPPSGPELYPEVAEVDKYGPAPLRSTPPGDGPMHVAWVVPPFSIGGGGHTTIFRMVQALERKGHRCSIWVHDPMGIDGKGEGTKRKRINDHYMQLSATVHNGFRHWTGADVVMATGWDTVYPVLRLEDCGARAYFVQDHEPEFYASSTKSLLAERSYRQGLHCICASPWLADIVRTKYGATATPFLLGSDTEAYQPSDVPRRRDTVVFYARHFTERRAVELGEMALTEVKKRLPDTRVLLYGTDAMQLLPFTYEHIGIVSPARLSRLYGEATVGLSLSLTNYSLIPQEMMACGLPVVELAGRACEGVFGDDGSVISLAQDNAIDIADKICELMLNDEKREQQGAAGLEFARKHTWDDAAAIVVGAIEKLYVDSSAPIGWRAGSLI